MHTPGPWRQGDHSWNILADRDGGPTLVGNAVFGGYTANAMQRAEVDANARLMAAAPSMLAALARAEKLLGAISHKVDVGPVYQAVANAIAEATGRQS